MDIEYIRIERNRPTHGVNCETRRIDPMMNYVRYDVSFRSIHLESPYHYKYEFYYADTGVYYSRDDIEWWIVTKGDIEEPYVCDVNPSKGFLTLPSLLLHDLIRNVDVFESENGPECMTIYTTNHTSRLQSVLDDLSEKISRLLPHATEVDRQSMPRFQEDMYSRGTYCMKDGIPYVNMIRFDPPMNLQPTAPISEMQMVESHPHCFSGII